MSVTQPETSPEKDLAEISKYVSFHSGEKLSAVEASRFMRGTPARMILCAGAKGSGKTTLLANFGEMFRDGSFPNYKFAGSLSLCAFERATWWATLVSGESHPDTPRTLRGENDTFFHVCVNPVEESSEKIHLLISDLAGETFPTAAGSADFCRDLRALACADSLVVFLDCAQLIDISKRHSEVDVALKFLQRVTKLVHASRLLQVQIVFSRWDYVLGSEDKSLQEAYCKELEKNFEQRFKEAFHSLEFFYLVVRSRAGVAATVSETQRLFSKWLESPIQIALPALKRNPTPARAFSAFGIQ